MWGANQWTDSMLKKFWWMIPILVALFVLVRFYY